MHYAADGNGVLNSRHDYAALAKESRCTIRVSDSNPGSLYVLVTPQEIPGHELCEERPETISGWMSDARARILQIEKFIGRNRTLGMRVEVVWPGGPYR